MIKQAAELDADARDALDSSDFAIPGKRKLPMHDLNHARLAWDMVDKTQGLSDEERATAKSRIKARLKQLGSPLDESKNAAEASTDDAEGHCHEHMHTHVNPADGSVIEHSHPHYHDDGDHLSDHDWEGHAHLVTPLPTRQAAQPDAAGVHVNVPIGAIKPKPAQDDDEDDDDKVDNKSGDDADEEDETSAAEVPIKPGHPFLKKLRELLSGKVNKDDYDSAVRTARAHAGGTARAARRQTAGEIGSLGTWRLFTDTGDLATAPEWIPYLPKPGTYQHPQWGKIDITRERNGRFVENFTKGVYQDRLPLDAEHETKLSGALGWVAGMRTNTDGSVDARVDWTDRGKKMLAERRFRYVSPEWYDNWRAPDSGELHKDIAIGGALTTRPFFKGDALRPLVASEGRLFMPQGGAVVSDDAPIVIFQEAAPVTPGQKGQSMTEQATTGAEDATKRFAELEARFAASEQARQAQETALKQATEKLAAMSNATRRKHFTDEVLGKSEESPIRWFGEPDKNVTMLEKLSDTFGEGSDEVKQYIEQGRATGELARKSNLFGEIGSGASGGPATAEGQLEALAHQYHEQHPEISYAKAYEVTFDSHPELQARFATERRRQQREA